ncbi:ATP-dependent DNA ligase [Candidatus Bathyarchaeota archaeon]|nr:ATP-dependent DNA ligase [Candidatus Bathyarchaeota archaeon]
MSTPFKVLAELCEKLEATKSRLLMLDLAAKFLNALEAQEIEPAVSMILGRPFQKWSPYNLGVSWATVSGMIRRITGVEWKTFAEVFSKTGDVGSATKIILESSRVRRQTALLENALTILEVRRSFEEIAETTGYGSRERKERLIEVLLGQASPIEAKYLVRIFIAGVRTGFHEGLMEQAVAKAFQIPLKVVQESSMTAGDIGEIAVMARTEGLKGLSKIGFRVFRPVNLMLAQMAANVTEALREHDGRTAFEYKYDGVRVQIHKLDDKVKVFSRRLVDVTESLPEIIEISRKNIMAKEAILEGEIIAVDDLDHPIPFQHLMRRFKKIHAMEDNVQRIPLKLYLFDILYVSGKSLVSVPYPQRRQLLTENAGKIQLTSQIVTSEVEKAEDFLKEAMDAGHEGLMAKRLDSLYTPGTRGKVWLKIKPVLEPLDLVIVAAEYGYGRRHGWLSDYYLAARDADTGEFLPVGKTFKGLTDAEIIEMTEKLKESAIEDEHGKVTVTPRIVVEVAYNEIQKSPKYKCGMALRFARITRIRDDKVPEDADTIQKVREIYEQQFLRKGRYKS